MNRKSPAVSRLMNWGEGGVVETSRIFQFATPALNHPARSPIRGSWRGADALVGAVCAAAPPQMTNERTSSSLDFTESSV